MMTRRSDSFVLMLLVAMALMAGCGKGSLLPQLGEDGRGGFHKLCCWLTR